MSQEFYFGEVDVRRFDRFESLLERIASKLEEPAPSASTNNARDEIAAAEKLCKIYFDIAASCIGEEAVRQRVAAATSPVA